METILDEHKIIWEEKPTLRKIYHDYYRRIVSFARPGKTLEIGGGSGNLKSYLTGVISTDIIPSHWLDACCDAQNLPFQSNTMDNIVGVDVLHHIEWPVRFFSEAERLLKPGGHIIFMEPAITCLSWFFYNFFHPEPVILNAHPLKDGVLDNTRSPFDANQAIPELIFGKYFHEFQNLFPNLQLKHKSYASLWAYPLSGGFRKWSLIPAFLTNGVLKIEKLFERLLGSFLGFRLFIVVEKAGVHSHEN